MGAFDDNGVIAMRFDPGRFGDELPKSSADMIDTARLDVTVSNIGRQDVLD